jgi:mono/diheme cytochrome c family protein
MNRIVKVLAVVGALAILGGMVGAIVAWRMLASGMSARPTPSPLEERVALKLRKLAVSGRYKQMKNPVTTDAEFLRGAMEHWADHCATCHANDGSGKTPVGSNMYPRPPDMRASRTQGMSDGEIYYVINQGIRLTGMPAWGKPGDDDRESWQLVAFIRTLPTLTAAQVEAMKAMNPVPARAVKAQQEEDEFLDGDNSDAHKGH